jgi:SHS family lactate transporter-like MFS transporter
LTTEQAKTFAASFLGWALDAFDFFLVVVLLPELSKAFAAPVARIAMAVTLTLALRPAGALIFGWFADRFGRRVPLMADVGLYSLLELLTALSPNLTFFLVVRALFGIAMGGEWGLGAALAMESLPPARRGLFSGILQVGYPVGNLLAGVALALLSGWIGWRGMFAVGALPALLIFYIRSHVPESPAWLASRADRLTVRGDVLLHSIKHSWGLVLYGIVLMTALNAMAHGSQDPYVTFLSLQRGLSHRVAGTLNAVAALGGIAGGVLFGWLSQRTGRRWGIVAACLFSSLAMALWVGGKTLPALAFGGFLMQVGVQGAWGIIPAHLNEIAPRLVRGTFPGFVYQIGNLVASPALQVIAILAASRFALPGGRADYASAMLLFMGCAFASVIALALLGFAIVPERREAALG